MRIASSSVAVALLLLFLVFALAGGRAAGSLVAHTVVANGNAQIDTAQSKLGGASGLFDGSGDYLSTPDSADWAFGGGDFTIDFWVRFNALPAVGQEHAIISQLANGNNLWWIEVRNSGGTYYWNFFQYEAGTETIAFKRSTTLSTNTWYHVAVVRSGNSWYWFQDGTQLGTTATISAAVANFAGSLYVGQVGNGAWYLNGWLDEVRVSKGAARWAGDFTPPASAYTADSYTMLLLHMDGANGSTTFLDDSALPPGPDFSISASPTSESMGAGSTASFTLNLAATGGFTETVSLSVTSGCPSGVTCTVSPTSIDSFPGSATLSVPTLITTSGSYSVVVTAASTSKTHTVTAIVSVSGAAQYAFNVKSGATQIVVTLMYAWTGSGAPPAGSITLAAPGGSPTYAESGAVVYDRTSIAHSSGSDAYTILHRVTFTVSDITSPQVWTALVSLASVSTYNVTIEVS